MLSLSLCGFNSKMNSVKCESEGLSHIVHIIVLCIKFNGLGFL